MPTNQGHQVSWVVEWGTGVTAGSVVIEGAATRTYSGTWTEITTETFAGTAPNLNAGTSPAPPAFVRARVSSVTDGTVTVRLNVHVNT